MTGWEAAVVQPGDDGLHGEMARNGHSRATMLGIGGERGGRDDNDFQFFRRRSRAGTRVREHCEELPLGIETAVWRPASGLRVITHGWKMKPEGWMRSPQ